MDLNLLLRLTKIPNSTASSALTIWSIADLFVKDKQLTQLNNCWHFTKMLTFTSMLNLTVVKRKRRRKSTPLKRKTNTSIKKSQDLLSHCTQSMVINDSNSGKGNVTQTRKTCPSCGPGVFMAQHWDRYYCGLCHTTIKMDAETIKKNE
jgi:ribosomal protein S27AE